MYDTQRYKTACKRNKTKRTVYAMMGLINYHINTEELKDILYPCEIQALNKILLDFSNMIENWQKVAPAYAEEE